MKKSVKRNLIAAAFIVPSLFIFINVVIIPFVMGIVYSFTDWDGFKFAGSNFVGFDNYVRVFQDSDFLTSFGLTFKYAVCMIILVNVIGLSLAMLVTSKIKSRNLLRSIYFLPNLIGGLILGFIWKFVFTKFFVQVGEVMGNSSIFFNWLDDPTASFWALVFVGTWQMAGYVMIIYIAAIQGVSDEVLEAADMDGAGGWMRFRKIMFPLIMPAFTISLFLTLSNAFKQYDTNISLTNGGPYGTTELVAMNIFKTAFSMNQYALAQSKAIIFFLVILVVTVTQVVISKKREVEQ
ncbi:sugar ABC transporter permease [Paenibacillus sp. FSL E2-8871]|uniref:Melibiose/raffinose/stachyose import permease protein MelD n=1 Tax=Paenibacillus pseudetheri TaxID=2897682 RepID=A0ABN8F9I1_9BACL|nr:MULTISPECIES: sugar ABC transporter permease [Paenibacillus]CAH1054369.1 Melibiose/raffinose/stachyose import permease protein MelD [Paenibacillus pseudetheri]